MNKLQLATSKAAAADAKQGTGGLLTSKVEAAGKSLLTSKVNPNQVWQVYGVIDRSGSMGYEYQNGTVQEVVNRLLAFAVIVDDDGSVPLILFDHTVMEREVKLGDFHNYISRNNIRAGGTTGLTEALETLCKATGNGDLVGGRGLFGRSTPAEAPTVKRSQTPVFAIIVTDGCPNDPRSATDLIRKLSYRGVFIKILFVGGDPKGWAYVESLDDDLPVGVPYEQGGRLIDNVDAKDVEDIRDISDKQFFDMMFDEVSTWTVAARQAGLI